MVKDDNYILIAGWMINRLRLKGNELMCYALLYGFNQNGDKYTGSIQYIADWLNIDERSVRRVLDSLEKKGLLERTKVKNADGEFQLLMVRMSEQETPKTEKKTRAKRQSLLEREPVNEIEEIEKLYLIKYRELYESGKLQLQNPPVKWANASIRTKEAITLYGKEKVMEIVELASKDKWCIDTNFLLTTILSNNVILKLVQKKSGVGVGSGADLNTVEVKF